MEVNLKKLPKSEIELEIEISAEELDGFIERVVLEFVKDAKYDGFRKGKAPRAVVEKELGEEKILANAAELAINEGYGKAIRENKINAASQPAVHIHKLAKGVPFIFCARVAVLPAIILPDYKKIAESVERKEIFVEDKEVENALKWLQKTRAKFTLKNEPAENGDFVEIEYWSQEIEGTVEPKGIKDAFILGEGKFLPGFEEKLVGMKAGEEKKDTSLAMPENYFAKNLAGRTINIRVKMNSVQRAELPEINDDFAKNLGNFENLSALKENIKRGISLEKKEAESQRVRNEILEKIDQKITMDIPESLVEAEKKRMMENFKKGVAEQLNISLEDYLNKVKKSEKELLDSFSSEAGRRIKNSLVLKEIGKKENISVQETEIDDEINKILKQYPGADKTRKELDPEKLKDYTKEAIYYEKTFQLLESYVK